MRQYAWNYDNEGNIIYDYSKDELSRRKEYLLEIDKYAKLSGEDITKDIKTGRSVLAYGPGLGKTTALRQFICNPKNYSEGILVATKRIEDVNKLAYDVSAFLGSRYEDKVIAIHSGSEIDSEVKSNPDYLKDYEIVITTHKRLLLDSPNVILGTNERYSTLGDHSDRQYVFIDEEPQYLIDIGATDQLMSYIFSVAVTMSRDQGVSIGDFSYKDLVKEITKQLMDPISFEYLIPLYKCIAKSMTYDDFACYNLRAKRFSHRLGVCCKYLLDKYPSRVDVPIYYHIGMLRSRHVVILDGTGDITNKGSSVWKVPITTERKLIIDSISVIPNTYLPRKPNSVIDYHEFADAIKRAHTGHNKVLVVTWKDLKGDSDRYLRELSSESKDNRTPTESRHTIVELTSDFIGYLKSKLPEDIAKNTMFLSYMSGKERVTSEFSECDTILFLGNFFLPNSEVAKLNELKGTELESKEYTKSLLIQSIYRTRARHNKGIKIYFSSDWRYEFLFELFKEFTILDYNMSYSTFYYRYNLSHFNYNSRNEVYYNFIKTRFTELIKYKEVEYIIPESMDLSNTKRAIQKMIKKNNFIEYHNIRQSNKFILKLI